MALGLGLVTLLCATPIHVCTIPVEALPPDGVYLFEGSQKLGLGAERGG